MKTYRKDINTGRIMEINTDGNYLCPGWSRTKEAAKKHTDEFLKRSNNETTTNDTRKNDNNLQYSANEIKLCSQL